MYRDHAIENFYIVKEASARVFSKGEGETIADVMYMPPALRARDAGFRRAQKEYDLTAKDRARIIREHDVRGIGTQAAENILPYFGGAGLGALAGMPFGGKGALIGMGAGAMAGSVYGHNQSMRRTERDMYQSAREYAQKNKIRRRG